MEHSSHNSPTNRFDLLSTRIAHRTVSVFHLWPYFLLYTKSPLTFILSLIDLFPSVTSLLLLRTSTLCHLHFTTGAPVSAAAVAVIRVQKIEQVTTVVVVVVYKMHWSASSHLVWTTAAAVDGTELVALLLLLLND